LIAAGRVRVNGRAVRGLGTQIADGDRVEVNGKRVELAVTPTYVVLNKPLGVVTTMRDPQRRTTVADLVPRAKGLFPVGRLDYNTTGVLLLTSDGALAHGLLHPSAGVEKTYRATIAGRLAAEDVRRLMQGMGLPEFQAAAAKVRVVAVRRDRSIVDLTIHEGRNRQVRRMFEALGHQVIALTRTRFGPLKLGGLPVGHFRSLSAKERAALERHRRRPAERSRTSS
jgi:23S rRNA pseudouridine2605 synthase